MPPSATRSRASTKVASKSGMSLPVSAGGMRFRLRSDLDGYAPKLATLKAIDGVEIVKPFVLLYGANGSGKTSLLKMIRGVNGLAGERGGVHPFKAQETRILSLEKAGGDLGILAGYDDFMGKRGLRKDVPGLLDVGALGWAGHRMYHLSGRSVTARASASAFDDTDFENHASLIMHAKEASHGQMLLPEWNNVMAWAAGLTTTKDPFDERRPTKKEINVNDVWRGSLLAHHDIYEACSGLKAGEPGRPEERWLLLDEPELAMDINNLCSVMSMLLAEARLGHLRVFCASHSPLFAAGLSDHPAVQVIDLSGGWLEVAKSAMRFVQNPDALVRGGAAVRAQVAKKIEARHNPVKKAVPKTPLRDTGSLKRK